ncbi:hypothetical protein RFI_18531 [Reticulomyxa filosa]|uniref:HutD-family protein n=1 Tax=Reticulomyxa filosa TaxID=46433 RepID=X6N074_RETFI|nr:hypothetical protein RFI_18531 [Reticulomyxa filosa]|eukprot:ETO18722.1 hypothetical protein RFI_18531 [Reticulomyxa filosa]
MAQNEIEEKSNTKLQFLQEKDYVSMPWKNKQGITKEVMKYPADSNIGNFEWRISIATCSTSSEFSKFLNCKRVIIQLEGEPMVLMHSTGSDENKSQSAHECKLYEPYIFDGDINTSSKISNTVTDFNVITNNTKFDSKVEVISVLGKKSITLDGQYNFVFVAKEPPIQLNDKQTLKKYDSVYSPGSISLDLQNHKTEVPSTVFLIQLYSKQK